MVKITGLLAGLFLLMITAMTQLDRPAVASAGRDDLPWIKTVVEKRFRSEGVAIADVNKDGKMDVLVGDLWYEAPDWKIHEIRKVGDYGDGLKGYSECMACWAGDFNGDQWPDLIVIGFPGKPALWYENPQGKAGHWKEHLLWHSACNETPTYTDLFGKGKKVLIMGWQPMGKEREGQMAWFAPGEDPTKPWVMNPISEPSSAGKEAPGTQRFSHGLGVGDVNSDGRLDVICTGGWWEQPATVEEGKAWRFYPANLGEACADMFAYDTDGDQKADIISSSAHRFGIWCFQQRGSAGEPTFIKQDLFKELFSESHAMHCVDLNGDGLKDLVTGKRWWSHGRSEPGSDKPSVLYWFEAKKTGDGVVQFTPRRIDEDSGIGTQFVVSDFNADGKLDIVTANKRGVFIFEQGMSKVQ